MVLKKFWKKQQDKKHREEVPSSSFPSLAYSGKNSPLAELFKEIQQYYGLASSSSSVLEAILHQQFATAEQLGMIKHVLFEHESQLREHSSLYKELLQRVSLLEQKLYGSSETSFLSPGSSRPSATVPYLAALKAPSSDVHAFAEETAYHLEQKIGIAPYRYKYIPYLVVYIPKNDTAFPLLQRELQSSLELFPPKEYVLPQPLQEPLEESSSSLWNLTMIEADKAWSMTKGNGIAVGIIDTGVDYTHPELSSRFDRNNLGYNFIIPGAPPFDDHGHGTHVAGTVAGKSVGVAPEVKLYALKVLGRDGRGSEENVIAAIEWALDNHLDIVNMSLGSSRSSRAEEEICKVAFQRGLVLVAAGGNRGSWSYEYPASHPGVIAVAALNHFKQRAEFSSMNDKLDIAAPGVHIYSATPGGMYDYKSGTSMATPHVTGVLALALSHKKMRNSDLEKIMKETAEKLGDTTKYGDGLVRAYHLLQAQY